MATPNYLKSHSVRPSTHLFHSDTYVGVLSQEPYVKYAAKSSFRVGSDKFNSSWIELSLGIDAGSSQPFGQSMDLEPGRCRRTDGKKWRCRLAVLPDQKYCDRHIHRGCLRSRKPVEHHKTSLTSKSTATITVSPLKSTINLQSATKIEDGNRKDVRIKNHSYKIKKRNREDVCAPLEFIFSPKSVLQNDNVAVPESERCRRTDGKKWRCTKITLQGQKYCAQHMHRGAKKVQIHQNSNTSLSFSLTASYQPKGNFGNQSNESTNSDDDEGSDPNGATNSSSSDATTISME